MNEGVSMREVTCAFLESAGSVFKRAAASLKKRIVIAILGCLFLAAFFGTNKVNADTVDDAKSVIGGIAMFKMSEAGAASVQEWADGAIRDGAGADSDAYAYALYRLGMADVSSYLDSLEKYLDENTVRSASTRLKYALCLCMKDSEHEYVKKTVDDSIGQLGIMSFVYGLHLANNGAVGSAYTPEQIALEILALQHPDGGWSVMGQNGDVDVTAMVLQALAGIGDGSDSSRPAAIEIAADRAVRFLSQKQNGDGGFSGFGNENAESTAQVLIALSSLGIDAAGDPAFEKNGKTVIDGILKYRLEDGTFAHVEGGDSDSSATSQVFTAMASYLCSLENEKFYMVGSPRSESLVVVEGSQKKSDFFANKGKNEGNNEGRVVTEKDNEMILQGQANPGSDIETIIQEQDDQGSNIKTILLFVILGLAVAASALLFIFKKRNPKNFLFVLLVAGVAALIVSFSDFKTESRYYTSDNEVENAVGEATISIRCDTIAGLGNSEDIPEDGVILDTTTYAFAEGDTVYDVLVRAVRENKLHMEKKKTGGGAKDCYICGIANIYEYDWGELSGWMYYVNGKSPSVGCGEYTLKPGDRIEWKYTREIGRDLGDGTYMSLKPVT
ncbi:MAG: DUF4430 domain-containing protein [Lachnospiraceae bacterium]|nr:DUF4430 domain-containing protein [Lachnospiraceae bacterium]